MEKLKKLRELMSGRGLDAYLQPVHDEWMSEYPPDCNRRVEWLTGFSGSAGLALVLAEKAAMFVDGRYTLQAAGQVSADYVVLNSGDITPQDWLRQQLPQSAKIGYDPKLYTKAMLYKFKNFQVVATENLIDELWEDRPPVPATSIFAHDVKYSGIEAAEKRQKVAEEIKKAGADALFISMPENVCWLLNIRARDTENTPLCLAFAIIDKDAYVRLFADPARVDKKLHLHLGESVRVYPLSSLSDELRSFSHKTMLSDTQTTSIFVTELCRNADVNMMAGTDPCTLLKALKNPVEIAGIGRAHIRDGAAVAKLLCWLEKQENVTELEVVDKLLLSRMQNELFLEPSFDTIAGSGAHGAVVHYRATPESNRTLQKGELFLLDSGGQYFDGTTDITRTVAIGEPSSEHKDRFTRVLKGHIALAQAVFPEGTVGSQLDALARQYLWQVGLDYDHGTGHGVGCFLGVHEGPQRIGKRGGDAPLAAGMVISNEPGYYKEGQYGIRIENLVTVEEKSSVKNGKKFFGFATLTCVPIDTRLVDAAMLTDSEKKWLNDYHAWVKAELSPQLDDDEKEWLARVCAAI
jgi:Xaa-Pro aminopeptidase